MAWSARQSYGRAERTQLRLDARSGKVTTSLIWDPTATAVIICDMWENHWCKSAARRCAILAPRVNEFAQTVRRLGTLVVHAPSDTMAFYEETSQRACARGAP